MPPLPPLVLPLELDELELVVVAGFELEQATGMAAKSERRMGA
jgi:hypothetical protein